MHQSSFIETHKVYIIGISVQLLTNVNNLQTVAKQINSNTNLELSRVYWIKNNVTDNFLSFVLNF